MQTTNLFDNEHNIDWVFSDQIYNLFLVNNPDKESNIKQTPKQLAEISFKVQIKEAGYDLTPTINHIAPTQLLPTQNRLNFSNCVLPQLTNKWNLTEDVFTKNVLSTIDGPQPILTFGSKYIIDGHHRWAQYMMSNPDAIIEVLNIPLIRNTQERFRIQNEYIKFKHNLKNYMMLNEIGTCYDFETFIEREEKRNSFRISFDDTVKLILTNITEDYIFHLFNFKKIEKPKKQHAMDFCMKNLQYFLHFC